jgi:DNA invertase Pin-like site-specific DNA recombinase
MAHNGGNRAAIYVRASTDKQTVEQQEHTLRAVADARGWKVIQVYRDEGISGAKRREQRPGLDSMLKDAKRRRFDVVMSWAIDRLGRSTIDLLSTVEELNAYRVDIYFDQQNIDTTTPMGKCFFTVSSAFAELERNGIQSRIKLKLDEIKETIKRDGKFTTKAGIVRSKLGRPGADKETLDKARKMLRYGAGIRKVAKTLHLGNGTVAKLKRELQDER